MAYGKAVTLNSSPSRLFLGTSTKLEAFFKPVLAELLIRWVELFSAPSYPWHLRHWTDPTALTDQAELWLLEPEDSLVPKQMTSSLMNRAGTAADAPVPKPETRQSGRNSSTLDSGKTFLLGRKILRLREEPLSFWRGFIARTSISAWYPNCINWVD